jgi:hypothetical protein
MTHLPYVVGDVVSFRYRDKSDKLYQEEVRQGEIKEIYSDLRLAIIHTVTHNQTKSFLVAFADIFLTSLPDEDQEGESVDVFL